MLLVGSVGLIFIVRCTTIASVEHHCGSRPMSGGAGSGLRGWRVQQWLWRNRHRSRVGASIDSISFSSAADAEALCYGFGNVGGGRAAAQRTMRR